MTFRSPSDTAPGTGGIHEARYRPRILHQRQFEGSRRHAGKYFALADFHNIVTTKPASRVAATLRCQRRAQMSVSCSFGSSEASTLRGRISFSNCSGSGRSVDSAGDPPSSYLEQIWVHFFGGGRESIRKTPRGSIRTARRTGRVARKSKSTHGCED